MRDEAQRQINLLLQQQEELAPELYRDLALYLQVLREGLLHAVQQACFHLATQVVPDRYNQLPPERRQAFQQRLQELVQRTGTLLTVEQVIGLAAQQQRREHRRQRAAARGGARRRARPPVAHARTPAQGADAGRLCATRHEPQHQQRHRACARCLRHSDRDGGAGRLLWRPEISPQ